MVDLLTTIDACQVQLDIVSLLFKFFFNFLNLSAWYFVFCLLKLILSLVTAIVFVVLIAVILCLLFYNRHNCSIYITLLFASFEIHITLLVCILQCFSYILVNLFFNCFHRL